MTRWPFPQVLVALLACILAGCPEGGSPGAPSSPVLTPALRSATEQPTPKQPLVVDAEHRQVRIYAEVNGRFLQEPTRHGIVFSGGSNGTETLLVTSVHHLAFHDALEEIGAHGTGALTLQSEPGKAVEGDPLQVTLTWGDRTLPLADAIRQEPGDTCVLDIRFGGNRQRAREKGTGCILCLDSCPVGITSSATWGFKSFASGRVLFQGRSDRLPADGSGVVATFSLP